MAYCGEQDHRALFDYCLAGVTDPGLRHLLRTFTGTLPYLRLIAECNAISDPFDAPIPARPVSDRLKKTQNESVTLL